MEKTEVNRIRTVHLLNVVLSKGCLSATAHCKILIKISFVENFHYLLKTGDERVFLPPFTFQSAGRCLFSKLVAEVIHGVSEAVVERAFSFADVADDGGFGEIEKRLLARVAEGVAAQLLPFYENEEEGDEVNGLVVRAHQPFCWRWAEKILEDEVEADGEFVLVHMFLEDAGGRGSARIRQP